jgi:hypothetical protein
MERPYWPGCDIPEIDFKDRWPEPEIKPRHYTEMPNNELSRKARQFNHEYYALFDKIDAARDQTKTRNEQIYAAREQGASLRMLGTMFCLTPGAVATILYRRKKVIKRTKGKRKNNVKDCGCFEERKGGACTE